jgi:hypothetical protein
MKTYAIINDSISLHPTLAEARQAVAAEPDANPALVLTSPEDLEASPLVMGQLVDLWNAMAGVVPFDDLKPVKKFTDRKTAVARIWKAIQRLEAHAAPPAAPSAPEAPPAPSPATAPPEAPPARGGTKKAVILDLLKRPEGASLEEMMRATEWAPHSVRGFLSGAIRKKMGLLLASTKTEQGERRYKLVAP